MFQINFIGEKLQRYKAFSFEILDIFLVLKFFIYFFFVYECFAWCPRKPEEYLMPWNWMEGMVVSCHVVLETKLRSSG